MDLPVRVMDPPERLVADPVEHQATTSVARDGADQEVQRPESAVPAEPGRSLPAEEAVRAPEPAEVWDSAAEGNMGAEGDAGRDHRAAALDAVWTGGFAGASGKARLLAGADAPPDPWPGALDWHDPGPVAGQVVAPRSAGQAAKPEDLTGKESGAVAALPRAERAQPGPQLADLLAGVLPFDGGALERGVEQFFAHLQGAVPAPTAASLARGLAPWLTSAALAAVALDLARRQRHAPVPRAPGLPAG
jgi:hypothetical protein